MLCQISTGSVIEYDFIYQVTYYLYWYDSLLVPLYIFIIYRVAKRYESSKIQRDGIYYKYFTNGLMIKIVGSLAFFAIFNFYYGFGDTFGYHRSNEAMFNLFFKNPYHFFVVLFGPNSPENFAFFDSKTTWPLYWGDDHAFFVVRLTTPLALLGFKSYLLTTILLQVVVFSGIWKLFLLFQEYFPGSYQKISISCFFIPTIIFWGSGLIKDGITLSCIGWFCYSFNKAIIKRKFILSNGIIMFVTSYVIISIKPYIFACLIPSSLIWMFFSVYSNIPNKMMRMVLLPVLIVIFTSSIFWLFNILKDELKQYSLDKIIISAAIIQDDLKQEYYGGTAFDIGSFEPTPGGVFKKFPQAIVATFFRPFIWEIKSPVIFFSAIESLILFLYVLKVIVTVGFLRFFVLVSNSPLIIFTFVFSLLFGFSVGLSTANFGSLVRYKIPAMIFFISTLSLVEYSYSKDKLKY